MSSRLERLARIYGERHRHLERTVPADDIVLAYLEEHLPADLSARMLDAGCGNGRYAQTLAGKGYRRIYGLDISPRVSADGLTYVRGDLERLPFAPKAFEMVVCVSAIYHLERPDKAIREIARVTGDGGFFVMTAHTPHSLFTNYRRAWTALGSRAYDKLTGLRFPSAGDYATWLRAEGFRVLLVDGYSLFGFRERIKLARRALLRVWPRAKWLRRPWRDQITRYRWLARLKSVMGYHMILVARKEPAR